MRLMQDLIRSPAGLEPAFVIGIAFEQVTIDALEALSGDLRSGGVIEEYGGTIKGGDVEQTPAQRGG
jgi:hypothetical protein